MIHLHDNASYMGVEPLRVMWLFWPFILLLICALPCLHARNAAEIRTRLFLLAGAVVIGSFLITAWFHVTDAVRSPSLLTRPLLAWILGVTIALAGHTLIHLSLDLRLLPPIKRNRVARGLIVASLMLGIVIVAGQARYWSVRYSDADAWSAHDVAQAAYEAGDRMTAEWRQQHPDQWEFLLLRANTLHERGRMAEAQALYGNLRQMDAAEWPDGLSTWLARFEAR